MQLTEALAEASAARRDAARHRAAADAAVRERSGTDTERARLAAEAERLNGEVRRLIGQLEEASSSCQAQVGREELNITSHLNRNYITKGTLLQSLIWDSDCASLDRSQ